VKLPPTCRETGELCRLCQKNRNTTLAANHLVHGHKTPPAEVQSKPRQRGAIFDGVEGERARRTNCERTLKEIRDGQTIRGGGKKGGGVIEEIQTSSSSSAKNKRNHRIKEKRGDKP